MTVEKSVAIQGTSIGSAAVASAPSLRATFNNSGNWTVPAGVKAIMFVLAGGGAGGSAASGDGGAGGSAGGIYIGTAIVTPGSTVAITIGAGGTGNTSTANQNGNVGGTTSLSAGNILYSVSGGYRYSTTDGYAQYPASAGSWNMPTSNTTGVAPIYPIVSTNFVLEMTPYIAGLSASNYYNNTIFTGGSELNGGVAQGAGTQQQLYSLSPVMNLPSSNTRGFASNFPGTNAQINNSFNFGGGGGPRSNYQNISNLWGPNFKPINGSGGLTGGGGAASDVVGYAGSGGDGMGGLGGAGNVAGGSWRGGGGGGGLTGAGSASNTASGGTGGSGGGGGGGAGSGGTGGSGGAGAVLIYY